MICERLSQSFTIEHWKRLTVWFDLPSGLHIHEHRSAYSSKSRSPVSCCDCVCEVAAVTCRVPLVSVAVQWIKKSPSAARKAGHVHLIQETWIQKRDIRLLFVLPSAYTLHHVFPVLLSASTSMSLLLFAFACRSFPVIWTKRVYGSFRKRSARMFVWFSSEAFREALNNN